jgi:hypothetical protein
MDPRKTLDERVTDWEPERLAEIAREDARMSTPEAITRREQRAAEQEALIQREIAEGLRNADGSPIEDIEDDDE